MTPPAPVARRTGMRRRIFPPLWGNLAILTKILVPTTVIHVTAGTLTAGIPTAKEPPVARGTGQLQHDLLIVMLRGDRPNRKSCRSAAIKRRGGSESGHVHFSGLLPGTATRRPHLKPSRSRYPHLSQASVVVPGVRSPRNSPGDSPPRCINTNSNRRDHRTGVPSRDRNRIAG